MAVAVLLTFLWLSSSVAWTVAVSRMLAGINSFTSVRTRNWDGRFLARNIQNFQTGNFLPLVVSAVSFSFNLKASYRQPGLLCSPQNLAPSSKILVKTIFWY
jgi:hypothetical protein